MSEIESQAEESAFVEMDDQEEKEEQDVYDDERENKDDGTALIGLVGMLFQCELFSNWFTKFNANLSDQSLDDFDAQLWVYMTRLEWEFLTQQAG